MLGRRSNHNCFKESVEMRAIYEMGLMLTFILLCISTMQFIVSDQLGNTNPGQPVNLNWNPDTNFSGTQGALTYTGTPSNDFVGGLLAIGGKVNNLWDLVSRFATGWQVVLKGIFRPEYGLSGIADLLIIVFDVILIITLIFFVGNMVSAVRGGGFS
jgi:hypothetical protein